MEGAEYASLKEVWKAHPDPTIVGLEDAIRSKYEELALNRTIERKASHIFATVATQKNKVKKEESRSAKKPAQTAKQKKKNKNFPRKSCDRCGLRGHGSDECYVDLSRLALRKSVDGQKNSAQAASSVSIDLPVNPSNCLSMFCVSESKNKKAKEKSRGHDFSAVLDSGASVDCLRETVQMEEVEESESTVNLASEAGKATSHSKGKVNVRIKSPFNKETIMKMVAAVCSFPSVSAAVKTTVQTLQASIPIARIELLDELSMKACNQYNKMDYKESPTLFLEFHGSPVEIEAQVALVGEIVAANEGSDFLWAREAEERNKLWQARHHLRYACLALRPGSRAMSTDVCVPISKLPEMIDLAKEIIAKSGLLGPIIGHVGDGNFHAILVFNPDDNQEFLTAKRVATELGEEALKLGGTCAGEHGIGHTKMDLLEKELGPETIAVMKNLKKAIDPNGLMNPGKVLHMESK